MAVYRSDQAQLTFATEAAQGADPEMIEGTAGTATALLKGASTAGTRGLLVDTVAAAVFVVGDFIRIGTLAGSAAATVDEHEVRRIELIEGDNTVDTPGDGATFVLDRPTAFWHADNEQVIEITAIGGAASRNDQGKMLTWIPGVYETVDTPDPEMSHEGRRFLGTTSKRNWSVSYPGQQTLTGSVSGIILLNGWPLRYPLGSVVTTPSAMAGGSLQLAAYAQKGDMFIELSGSTGLAVGDLLCIDDGDANASEVRRLVTNPAGVYWRLNSPLQFAHASGTSVDEVSAGATFTHSIKEKVDLDTVSWHIHMKESSETAAKNFDRRYVGGMIGSATIAAEEGGMVTMSWDTVNFLNMVHNQANQLTVGAASLYANASIAANMPRYGLMQSIDSDDIGPPSYGNVGIPGENNGTGYPNTQPYYFSQGSVKFFGQEFARVRSFSISIANGEEPRYYLGRQGARARGPYEIKEGAREYSMSATLVLPDATVASAASPGNATQSGALELFRQLLLEGDYGGSTNTSARTGFTASLRFDRGADDYIIIDIPGSSTAGTPSTATNQLNSQGIFINTAPHGLTTDNPFQIDADMMFRGLQITIKDSEPIYP